MKCKIRKYLEYYLPFQRHKMWEKKIRVKNKGGMERKKGSMLIATLSFIYKPLIILYIKQIQIHIIITNGTPFSKI